MKIIKKARSGVEKAWGKQKIKETEYRLLRYTLTTECEEGQLLYNVVTGELVLLDPKEEILIKNLPSNYTSEYNELVEKHFLVPVDYDEHKVVGQLRRLLTAMEGKKTIQGYTILPTTYCNARCFYCYESDFPHVHMTEETAHDVVEYMASHSDGKKISIGWFGGEPLLGAKIISQISNELADKGIEYRASMISNGYLFDEDMVTEAKEVWKLSGVQITIDGTEEVYNKTKSYVSVPKSPYRRVLRNIRLLSEAGITVSIRINLGFHNVEDIEALIDELGKEFSGNDKVSAYVHELFDGEGFTPTSYGDGEMIRLLEKIEELTKVLEAKGLYQAKPGLPSLATHHCMADNDGSVMIHPGGELTKCEHDSAEMSFGSIYSEKKDTKNLAAWKVSMEYEACKDCAIYPSCVRLKQCPNEREYFSGVCERSVEEAVKAISIEYQEKREKV